MLSAPKILKDAVVMRPLVIVLLVVVHSFAVYVFCQFILKFIYYNTDLLCVFGPYWLPFIGLCLTLVTSVLLDKLVKPTRVGKLLLG